MTGIEHIHDIPVIYYDLCNRDQFLQQKCPHYINALILDWGQWFRTAV